MEPTAHGRMFARLKAMADDDVVRRLVHADFCQTFQLLGLNRRSSQLLTGEILYAIDHADNLGNLETAVATSLAQQTALTTEGPRSLPNALTLALQNRAQIIWEQIGTFVGDGKDGILDYGTGDRRVAQLMADQLKCHVVGADVVDYGAPGLTVPFHKIENGRAPFPDQSFRVGVVTNVLHHSEDNDAVIADLTRVVRRKLVVIETVPMGETAAELRQDAERTFGSDWLYNRPFHPGADIPVPGTYETIPGWIQRFKNHGWKVSYQQYLGIDIPVIQDHHQLYVFSRER